MQVPSKSPIHHWVTPFLSINMTVIYIIKKWWNDMKWCQGQRISLYVHDFPDENFHEMLFFCGSSQVSKRKQVVNHGDFPPEILHSRNHQLRQHQTGLLKQQRCEFSNKKMYYVECTTLLVVESTACSRSFKHWVAKHPGITQYGIRNCCSKIQFSAPKPKTIWFWSKLQKDFFKKYQRQNMNGGEVV